MKIFHGPPGSTPLEPEDQEGLIPTWIASRGDLNAAEASNIAAATRWARSRRWRTEGISQDWLKELHRRMLADVWRWAGSYRVRDTNIGVPWSHVGVSVEETIRDMNAQVDSMPPDEVAIRFHHRLVSVHPFPNGNGRHARLAADTLVVGLGEKAFTWGAGDGLVDAGPVREAYLGALRRADEGDIVPLLDLARS